MRITDVQYDQYAVVHTIKTKEGVSEVLNKLYSKLAVSHNSPASLQGVIVCWLAGFEIWLRLKQLILCLQVALLRSVSTCRGSSHSSPWELASTLTTLSSWLRIVSSYLTLKCTSFFSENTWDLCSLSSPCVRLQLSVQRNEESFAILHLLLYEVRGFHLISPPLLWCLQHHEAAPETMKLLHSLLHTKD